MTTWHTTDKGANISLSGGDLIATSTSGGSVSTQYIISSTSKSSGKHVLRLTGDLSDGATYGTYNQGGITTDNTSLEGSDLDSYHLYQQGGDEWDLRNNGARLAFEYPYTSFATPADGTDVLDIYLNLDDDLLYFKMNGTFLLNSKNYPNPPDPTTPVGGIPIAHGTYFVYRIIYSGGVSLTMDPSPTGLPAGWSAWDAGGGAGVVGKGYGISQAINRASSW